MTVAQVPDVRVRLSPEGVSEVVGAFQRVRREAEHTGQVSTRAVGTLTNAVGELVRLIPAISFAVLTREIFTRTVEAERILHRLDTVLKTTGFSAGITAKELNEIAEALKNTTPFDDDDIRKGIAALLRFRDVQGDVFREAAKLAPDLAVALETDIVSAFQSLGRALQNPATGMRTLRAAGVQLSESQIELAEKLKSTGDTAGSMRVILDALTKSVGGAAAGENVGLHGSVKSLAKAWDDLLKALGKRLSGGETSIIATITKDLKTLERTIADSTILQSLLAFATFGLVTPKPDRKAGDEEIEELDKQIQLVRQQLSAGSLNPPREGKSLFSFLVPDIKLGKEAIAELNKTLSRLEAERARLVRLQGEAIPTTVATTSTGDADAERARQGQLARDAERANEAAILNRRNQLEKSIALGRVAADHELQVEKDLASQRLRVLDQYFSQSLISLEDFHQARRTIITSELQKELAAIQAKMLEEVNVLERSKERGASPEEIQKQIAALVAIQKLFGQRQLLEQRASAAIIDSVMQESAQREQLGKEQLSLDVKLLESQGRRKDAALLALEQEIKETEKLLKLRGQTPAQITARTGEVRTAATRNIEFDEQTRQSSLALRQIELEREEINRQVAQGILFQFQGEEKIIELERRRLPVLREIAAEMQRTAFTDEQRLAADEFASSVERIAVNINKAGREMAEFKQRAFDAVQSNLSTFFTDGIRDAKNFGEAVKTLAFNLVQSFQKINADILAKKLTEKAFSFLGIATDGPEKVAIASAAGTAQAAPLTAAATLMQSALTIGAGAVSAAAAQLMAAAGALAGAGATSGIGVGLAGSLAATSMVATGGGGFVGALAQGGVVRGPGTGTSDSIPVRLSTGEYVVRARAVQQPGNLEILQAINGMRRVSIRTPDRTPYVPRFAEGGLVGGGRNSALDSSMTVGLEEGLVLRHMDTPEGQRVFLKLAQKNKRALRGALGI